MIHLTPYHQNETSLSPVRGRGMGLCKLFDFLNLGINNKYVTFGIHKGVSGNNIPNFIASVCKASFICGLLKTKCRHIRFNHNHRSRMCICSAARCSASKCVTSVWPTLHCASYIAQSRSSSSAIAAIRLFSASCTPSPPCETD